MDSDKCCTSMEKHNCHICALHSRGLTKAVLEMTDNPCVTCAICLVNANSPDYVCSPTTLGRVYNYSDMQDSKKVICESVDSMVHGELLAETRGTKERRR